MIKLIIKAILITTAVLCTIYVFLFFTYFVPAANTQRNIQDKLDKKRIERKNKEDREFKKSYEARILKEENEKQYIFKPRKDTATL